MPPAKDDDWLEEKIQIQHLLKLNLVPGVGAVTAFPIQIQHLLKLNKYSCLNSPFMV